MDQEWQFHIATDILWSMMNISHCYWHVVVKDGNFILILASSITIGNFTLILISIGQEWQFHIATDIQWSQMAISHCYWHIVVKNGNITLLLTYSSQEWQFYTATDIHGSRMAISHCYWHLVVNDEYFTLLLTCSGQGWQFHITTGI